MKTKYFYLIAIMIIAFLCESANAQLTKIYTRTISVDDFHELMKDSVKDFFRLEDLNNYLRIRAFNDTLYCCTLTGVIAKNLKENSDWEHVAFKGIPIADVVKRENELIGMVCKTAMKFTVDSLILKTNLTTHDIIDVTPYDLMSPLYEESQTLYHDEIFITSSFDYDNKYTDSFLFSPIPCTHAIITNDYGDNWRYCYHHNPYEIIEEERPTWTAFFRNNLLFQMDHIGIDDYELFNIDYDGNLLQHITTSTYSIPIREVECVSYDDQKIAVVASEWFLQSVLIGPKSEEFDNLMYTHDSTDFEDPSGEDYYSKSEYDEGLYTNAKKFVNLAFDDENKKMYAVAKRNKLSANGNVTLEFYHSDYPYKYWKKFLTTDDIEEKNFSSVDMIYSTGNLYIATDNYCVYRVDAMPTSNIEDSNIADTTISYDNVGKMIVVSGDSDYGKVTVANLNGVKVIDSGENTIDISHLTKGCYLVTLISSEEGVLETMKILR